MVVRREHVLEDAVDARHSQDLPHILNVLLPFFCQRKFTLHWWEADERGALRRSPSCIDADVQVVHSTTLKRSSAPVGWLKPRGPEGQQGPAPLPLKARDKELINKAALGALMSTSHPREYALN